MPNHRAVSRSSGLVTSFLPWRIIKSVENIQSPQSRGLEVGRMRVVGSFKIQGKSIALPEPITTRGILKNNDLLLCEEKILKIVMLKEKGIYWLTSWALVVATQIIQRGKWEDHAPLNRLTPLTTTTNPTYPNVINKTHLYLYRRALSLPQGSDPQGHLIVETTLGKNTSFSFWHIKPSLKPLFHTRKIQIPHNLLGNVIVFTDLHMAENVGQFLGNKNFDLIHRATQL